MGHSPNGLGHLKTGSGVEFTRRQSNADLPYNAEVWECRSMALKRRG
jgi:hypothetical protein